MQPGTVNVCVYVFTCVSCRPYLSPKLFHERLQFAEEVITLVEECKVGVHEGQHLWRWQQLLRDPTGLMSRSFDVVEKYTYRFQDFRSSFGL